MKLFFLLWILPVTLGTLDTQVTCIYSEECVLPCTSPYLDIIHWYKDKKAVHSFFLNQDQLDHQDEDYEGRTSLLSKSEIKNGNVSVMIRNIRVQDEGRYRCYTESEKAHSEKYVVVSVEALAKSVDIKLKDYTVICRCSGVYPEPTVSWSSDPPAKKLLNTVRRTEDRLFTVTSQLKVDVITDTYTYNCSITTKNTRYTATLKQQAKLISWQTIITVIASLAVVAAVLIMKHKGCSQSSNTHEAATEMQPIRDTAGNSGAPTEDNCLTEVATSRP